MINGKNQKFSKKPYKKKNLFLAHFSINLNLNLKSNNLITYKGFIYMEHLVAVKLI